MKPAVFAVPIAEALEHLIGQRRYQDRHDGQGSKGAQQQGLLRLVGH